MDPYRDGAIRDATVIMQIILAEDEDSSFMKQLAKQWLHDFGAGEGHSPEREFLGVDNKFNPIYATVCSTCGKELSPEVIAKYDDGSG